jgi:phosphate transport system substrate-binding protein
MEWGHSKGSEFSRRSFVLALSGVGTLATAGCTGESSSTSPSTQSPAAATRTDRLEGTVDVAGSSTVYPLTLRVGEQFSEVHSAVDVAVASTGTGGGFTGFFCVGKTDVNDASRPISDAERDLCADNGFAFVRFQVATDALTVIVNNEADWIDCITTEELAMMWRRGGAETWADVREGWPEEPIEHHGPTVDSGTLDYFAEEIIGDVDQHREDYEGTEQDSTIVENVRTSEYAVGYLGFAYYTQNSESVTALGIDDGAGCVRPSLSTAETGSYAPLSRPLYVYVRRESLADPVVASFLRYYLDQIDTSLVSEVGYVPMDEDAAEAQRSKLSEAVDTVRD